MLQCLPGCNRSCLQCASSPVTMPSGRGSFGHLIWYSVLYTTSLCGAATDTPDFTARSPNSRSGLGGHGLLSTVYRRSRDRRSSQRFVPWVGECSWVRFTDIYIYSAMRHNSCWRWSRKVVSGLGRQHAIASSAVHPGCRNPSASACGSPK